MLKTSLLPTPFSLLSLLSSTHPHFTVFIFSFLKVEWVSLVGSHHKAVPKREAWSGRESPLLPPVKLNFRIPRAHSWMWLPGPGLWGRGGAR